MRILFSLPHKGGAHSAAGREWGNGSREPGSVTDPVEFGDPIIKHG